MAWSGYQLFLAALLIFTGSINTIATKWADRGVAPGRPDGQSRDGNSTALPHSFNHSFLQALGMFFGEFTCLIFFKLFQWCIVKRREGGEEDQEGIPFILRGNRDFNPIIFLAPTLCDMIGTTTMYIGLNLTFASSAQMFRGAVIIFTGIFSTMFLDRKLRLYQWTGILIVLCGLAIVGCADIFFGDNHNPGASNVFVGDLLIVVAQVITATQMVLEEKFVVGKNIASIQAVGWEGFFGVICMGSLLVPLSYIQYENAPIEDTVDGLYQMIHSPQIAIGFFGTVLSISFFNFAGVSITKELSATTRMVLDSVRTLVIWLFTMIAGWNGFIPLTLLGFAVLVFGMMLYNKVLIVPFLIARGCMSDPDAEEDEEERSILRQEDA